MFFTGGRLEFFRQAEALGEYLMNSGIPSCAFYLAASAVGGNAWERIAASPAYRRKGKEEVTSPWTAPWLERTVEQGYDEPFPTGVVERHRIGKLRVEYEPFRECIVDLGLATDRITSDGHRPGASRRETTFDLRVRYWGAFDGKKWIHCGPVKR